VVEKMKSGLKRVDRKLKKYSSFFSRRFKREKESTNFAYQRIITPWEKLLIFRVGVIKEKSNSQHM